MLQTWHLFAALSVVTGSLASLSIRHMMKRDNNDPVVFMIAFQFLLTTITFTYSLFVGVEAPPIIRMWPFFLLSGAFYAAGVLCNFSGSKLIGAGEMNIVTSVGAVVSIVLGIGFLSTPFGIKEVIGTALILSSIVILYGREKMKLNKGVSYGLGVAFFYGVAAVSDVFIIRHYKNPASFIPVMSFIPGFIMAMMFPGKLKKLAVFMERKHLRNILIYTSFYAFAAICYYQSLASGANVSQLSAISRASIITTVILGAVFLGERRDMKRKFVSALMVSAGVVMLG